MSFCRVWACMISSFSRNNFTLTKMYKNDSVSTYPSPGFCVLQNHSTMVHTRKLQGSRSHAVIRVCHLSHFIPSSTPASSSSDGDLFGQKNLEKTGGASHYPERCWCAGSAGARLLGGGFRSDSQPCPRKGYSMRSGRRS